MKNKRAAHEEKIEKFQQKMEEIDKVNRLHLQNYVSSIEYKFRKNVIHVIL